MKNRNPSPAFISILIAAFGLMAVCRNAIADAPVFTWNGGGTDGNWTTGANWGGTAPGSPQNILNFAGSTRLNNTNNFGVGSAGYRIFFNSGAGSFNLNGNGIRFFDFGGLDPKIENSSATAQTVNFAITNANTTLSGVVCPIEMNPVSGHLTNLNLVNLLASTNQLQVWGNNGNTLNFGPASVISGPGSVAINQNSTVLYQSAHTYTGDTFINAGTLLINGGGSANSSIVRVGDTSGASPAVLAFGANANLNSTVVIRSGSSGMKFFASGIAAGNATNSGNVFLDADLVITNGGALVFNGAAFDLKNQTLFITNIGTVTINSILTNSTGSGKLSKYGGAGTLNLGGLNSFTGGTTLNAGVIQANNGSAFGSGNITVNTPGTGKILLNGVTITNNITMMAASAGTAQGVIQAVDATSPAWSGIITVNSNAASGGHFCGPTTSGLLTISGPVNIGGSATTILVRDGFVRFSAGGSYTNIETRNRTNSIGAVNGLSTAAVLDLAGNGSLTVPTTFDLNGFDQTLAGLKNAVNPQNIARVTNSSATAATLTLDLGANVVSYSGSIMGNLALTVISGTQTLATNTSGTLGNSSFAYTGDTTISGGTLRAGFDNVLPNGPGKGNVVVNGTGTLDLRSPIIAVNGLSGNGTVDTGGNGQAFTVGNNNVSSIFSGVIKSTVGTLTVTKAGTGTQTLSGNNTFGGTINLSAGVVRLAHNNAAGSGTKTIASVSRTAGLEVDGGVTIPSNINLALSNDGNGSTVPYALRSVTGVNAINGAVRMTSGGGFPIVTVDSGSTLVFNGPITNDVGRNLIVQGSGSGIINGVLANGVGTSSLQVNGGTWTLNAANTYTGVTTNTGSTLVLGPNGSISNSTIVIAGVGGLLDVSQVNGGFSVNGAIAQLLGGSGVITGNVAAASGARISPGASAGTLTFTNNLTESGGVTNVFELSNVTTEGSGVNDEIVVGGNVNLSGINTILISPIAGTLANGTYKIIKYSGTLNGGATNFVAAFTTTPPRTSVTIVDTTPGEIDLVITATPASLAWQGDGFNNTWNAVSSNWLNGASQDLFFSGDSVTFDDSATNLLVSITNAVNPASVVVNASANYTFTNNGKISGSTGLTKTNSGTLTIATTNDFVGKTTIGGGTIAMAAETGLGGNPSSFTADQLLLNGGALRATATFTVDDANRGLTLGSGGGTLNTDSGITLTVGTVITGAGAITKTGSGTLTLNAANTFTNTTTVSQGTLIIGNNSSLGTADGGTTVGTGTQVRTTSSLTLAEPFTLNSAGGAISVGGNRNLTLNGPITLASGTAIHADGGSSVTINGAVSGTDTSFTNDLNGTATTTINGAITLGAGTFVQQGATIILTNTGNTWSGGTLTTGTLQVGNGGQSGSLGAGAITDNGALNFNSAAVLTVNDPISGSGSISQNGAGTVTLNGDISSIGTITANSGTLVLTGNSSFTNGLTINRPNGPIVRIGSNNALGSSAGGTFILGNNNGSGRLELSNNITVTEPISVDCRQAPVADASAILNVSGNNTLSGNITVAVGGSEINIQSDNGTLTMAGNLVMGLTGTRNLKLMGAGSGVWSGVITNISEVIKTNSGTWTLSGANTYSSPTTVTQGVLRASNTSGSATGTGTVTVGAGATLTGNGSIAGAVVLNGAIKPGDSVGALSTGPQTWNGGASYSAEVIDATNAPGVGFDSLNVTGGINLQAIATNPFTINLVSLDGSGNAGTVTNFDNNSRYSWTIATTTGSVTNFDTSKFTLNDTTFSNDLAGGFFFLEGGSLTVSFTNNHPPVTTQVTLARPRGTPTKIKLVDLATNWSDADADAMTFVSVATSSTNGLNNISTNDTYLFYNPGTNGDVTDLVSYVIRDVRSSYTTRPNDTLRTAAGTILITIAPDSTNQTFNVIGIAPLPDGNQRISFAGIPGTNYLVQAATNLSPPISWLTISTDTAGTNGLWYFDDLEATNFTSRFYRSAQP